MAARARCPPGPGLAPPSLTVPARTRRVKSPSLTSKVRVTCTSVALMQRYLMCSIACSAALYKVGKELYCTLAVYTVLTLQVKSRVAVR